MILWISASSLGAPSSLQGNIPWDFSKQIPVKAKVCSAVILGCVPFFCHALPQDLKFRHLKVILAKAPVFAFPASSSLLGFKYQMQPRSSPCWLLSCLLQMVVILASQNLSVFFCTLLCCPTSRSPVRTGAREYWASSSCPKKSYLPFFILIQSVWMSPEEKDYF